MISRDFSPLFLLYLSSFPFGCSVSFVSSFLLYLLIVKKRSCCNLFSSRKRCSSRFISTLLLQTAQFHLLFRESRRFIAKRTYLEREAICEVIFEDSQRDDRVARPSFSSLPSLNLSCFSTMSTSLRRVIPSRQLQRVISNSTFIPASSSKSSSRSFHSSTKSLNSRLDKPFFAFDLDGVVKQGEIILPAGKRALKRLKQERTPFIIITNSGGQGEVERAQKLTEQLEIEVSIVAQCLEELEVG